MRELESQLFDATKTFNEQKLEQLYPSNLTQTIQTSLLNFAIGIDNIIAVKFLLDKNINLNEPDELGQIPIFVAIDNLQPNYVNLLLKKGVLNIDPANFALLRDPIANTLYHAIFFASFKQRLMQNIPENIPDENISNAVRQILQAILAIGKEKEFSVNIQNMHGATPLHYAAASFEKAALMDLLNSQPILNIKDNEGKIPLDYALQKHNVENALALIVKASEEAKLIFQQGNNKTLTKKSITIKQLENFFEKGGAQLKGISFNHTLEDSIYVKEFIFSETDIKILCSQLLKNSTLTSINTDFSELHLVEKENTLVENPTEINDNTSTVQSAFINSPLSKFFSKRKFIFSLFIYTLFMQKLMYGLSCLYKNSKDVIKASVKAGQVNVHLIKYKLLKAFVVSWALTSILYQKVVSVIKQSPKNIAIEIMQNQSKLPFKLK